MELDVAIQPIVKLATREVIGYEALARPDAAPVAPAALFEAALANVEALRDAGALFALDDFGSGYTHMRWLHDIRPHFIKIAQPLVVDFESVPWRRSVVQDIQSFAKDIGCAVIAEGIESAATAAAAARELGIEFGQGYYFGRPAIIEYSVGCGTSPSRGNARTSVTASTSPS